MESTNDLRYGAQGARPRIGRLLAIGPGHEPVERFVGEKRARRIKQVTFAYFEELAFALSSPRFVKETAFSIHTLANEVEEFLHLIDMGLFGNPWLGDRVV